MRRHHNEIAEERCCQWSIDIDVLSEIARGRIDGARTLFSAKEAICRWSVAFLRDQLHRPLPNRTFPAEGRHTSQGYESKLSVVE
jgi:hypothetical protein